MEFSREQTRSLLQKWRDEKRVIHCGLFYSRHSSCAVIGRIEHLDSDSMRVDARGRDIAGKHYGLALKLSDIVRFHFETSEHQGYEGAIFAELIGGWSCEIHATKLIEKELVPD